MCNPILVGMAIGAASSAIQGGGIKEIAIGAAFGAVGGAVSAGGIGAGFTSFGNVFSAVPGQFLTGAATAAAQYGSAGALLGSMVTGTGAFAQPDYSQSYEPQGFSSQHATVTGSGGKQAAFSLAESVRRAKKRKLTQEDVSDLSIDTSSFASEGLQFA